MSKYDIAVIGGGPAGYVAAIRASQLGFKTAVIEREHLGGICLNWGCIPTKALLKTSELFAAIGHAADFGITVDKPTSDIKKIVQRSRDVSAQLSGGIGHLMKKHKIDVITGHAEFDKNKNLIVDGKQIQATHKIIATGARARILPGLEPDGKQIWTYKEAMTPAELPKSIIVVGSGAIGVEFASFYNALGVDVTVVEVLDRILPQEDAEISKIAAKSFTAQGIKILTQTQVKALKKGKEVEATLEDAKGKQQTLKAEKVIMAVGVVGNTDGMGLENLNIQIERSQILTNGYGQTQEGGIYAVGDVAGVPWLAHKASHEAIICVENIAGKKVKPIKLDNIPGCTYTSPQIASVGLTEDACKQQGKDIKVGRFPFMANGKAIAAGKTEGLIKTIFDKNTGELLGAHMIGAEVTELIQGFVIAKTLEATEEDLMHTIFPHPTLSEMIHESVLDADGEALHI